MKCIILCAGKGTRMLPLTKTLPKCMLDYNGRNLLEHKLDILPTEVDEVYIVVGYLGDIIIDYFGDEYRHFKIKYIWMNNLNGTGGAVELFKNYLKPNEKFLVLMGDDIYSKNGIEEVVNLSKSSNELYVGVHKSEFIEGKPMFFDDEDYLSSFDDNSNLENTGLYLLDKNYFNLEYCTIKNGKEISIPHTLVKSAHKYKIKKFLLRKWKKINSIRDLET